MQLRYLSTRMIVRLMSLCLLVGVIAGMPAITYAASLSTKGNLNPSVTNPAHTTSYYESTTSALTLESQGCSAARGSKGIVVLDFGEPALSGSTYGTHLFSNAFVSDSTITTAVKNFVNKAWSCKKSSTNIKLAIGTNNYGGNLGHASNSTWNTAGKRWGSLVNSVQSYISSKHYSSKIIASGADDLETEWASYGQSSSFVNGYNSASYLTLFDYGDDTPGYWTSAQVWYVATGANDDTALPEIYYKADATQDWESVSYWGCQHKGRPIIFDGIITDYPYDGHLPAAQAWADMYNAEGAHSCTAAVRSWLTYSTDI